MRFLLNLIVLAVLAAASPAWGAQCTVADPTGTPLNVRDTPGGEVSGTLENGLTVFIYDEDDSQWASVFSSTGLHIGTVFKRYLKCKKSKVNKTYPLILSGKQTAKLGMSYVPSLRLPGGECFYVGDGLPVLTIDKALAAKLKKEGEPFEAFCMTRRVDGLRYDPETGRRLRTFVIAEDLPDFPAEFPLETPTCLRKARVAIQQFGAEMSFRSCRLRFNPYTGDKITAADERYLRKHGAIVDGAASPSVSEASVTAARGKKKASDRDVERLAKELKN